MSVFTLSEDGRYGWPEIYTDEDIVNVSIFDNLEIDLKTVFNLFWFMQKASIYFLEIY